jgi:hypothetical protein
MCTQVILYIRVLRQDETSLFRLLPGVSLFGFGLMLVVVLGDCCWLCGMLFLFFLVLSSLCCWVLFVCCFVFNIFPDEIARKQHRTLLKKQNLSKTLKRAKYASDCVFVRSDEGYRRTTITQQENDDHLATHTGFQGLSLSEMRNSFGHY